MKIILHCHNFNRDSPIKDLDFLAYFTEKDNIQDMLEAQAFLTLHWFLDGFVLIQFDQMVGMTRSWGEETMCRSETLKYLLIDYAKEKDISKAVQNFQNLWDTKQKQDEDKNSSPADWTMLLAVAATHFPRRKVSTSTMTVWLQPLLPWSIDSATHKRGVRTWKWSK